MLSIVLKASNTSEWLNLTLTPDKDGSLGLAIAGNYQGQYLQIDFDDLESDDVDDLIWFLQRRRDQMSALIPVETAEEMIARMSDPEDTQ